MKFYYENVSNIGNHHNRRTGISAKISYLHALLIDRIVIRPLITDTQTDTSDWQTDKSTNGQTDGCYQAHYFPVLLSYTVNNYILTNGKIKQNPKCEFFFSCWHIISLPEGLS